MHKEHVNPMNCRQGAEGDEMSPLSELLPETVLTPPVRSPLDLVVAISSLASAGLAMLGYGIALYGSLSVMSGITDATRATGNSMAVIGGGFAAGIGIGWTIATALSFLLPLNCLGMLLGEWPFAVRMDALWGCSRCWPMCSARRYLAASWPCVCRVEAKGQPVGQA